MLPYQRYGSLRDSTRAAASAVHARGEEDSDEEDEHMYGSYCLIPPNNIGAQPRSAGAAISTGWESESDSSDADTDKPPLSTSAATSASLAGLKLSPNKHGPSSTISRARQQKVLDRLFDPTATTFSASGAKHHRVSAGSAKQQFDPAARAGPIAPADKPSDHDNAEQSPTDSQHVHTADDDDDDDDWEQDVDEEFTFLDNEIELGDMV